MGKYRDTIEFLQENGWIKDTEHSDKGYCVRGAMRQVWGESSFSSHRLIVGPLNSVIKEQFPDRLHWNCNNLSCIIPAFNDHEDTTFDDVALVLEKADMKEEEINAF